MCTDQKEFLLAELLDHPVLILELVNGGMEPRSATLLVEVASDSREREPTRVEEPVFA